MSCIDRAELDAVRNHISNTPPIGAMYAPVLVEHCCSLLDEVERLTADPLPAAAWVREVERAAFQRGAEAMRTALLQRLSWGSDLADRIRDEPVPEDE